jgi:hypothetical protein
MRLQIRERSGLEKYVWKSPYADSNYVPVRWAVDVA